MRIANVNVENLKADKKVSEMLFFWIEPLKKPTLNRPRYARVGLFATVDSQCVGHAALRATNFCTRHLEDVKLYCMQGY